MEWDSALYHKQHGFVAEYGKRLLNFVDGGKHRDVLDLGCGTGDLMVELSKICEHVIGIDASQDMVDTARERHPKLDFRVLDALDLCFEDAFDLVFSNVVFHWILNQGKLLDNVYRSLKGGGMLVCEFGAQGNIQRIEQAYLSAVSEFGGTYSLPFFFPSEEKYRKMLRNKGFSIEYMIVYDRPTPLKGGEEGLGNWLRQFFGGDLAGYPPQDQQDIFEKVAFSLRDSLWDGSQWIADYRRIQLVAKKAEQKT